jgi:hypothetical protein
MNPILIPVFVVHTQDYFVSDIGNLKIIYIGTRDSVVAKTLCYKPEGRTFETR